MNLPCIPLATVPMPSPAKVIVMPDGNVLAQNNRFERMLWSRHTLAEVKRNHEREQQKSEAERYAEQWKVAA